MTSIEAAGSNDGDAGTAQEPRMTDIVEVVKTTCPYCGTGCGVSAGLRADGSVDISGDVEHPANFGRLCVKGAALAETLVPDGRLLHPEIAGARVSWEAALARIAEAFGDAMRNHGPDSVALYVSGQILTEDYYVANKFMKGYVGSANIDTNSRLCMASTVAGHKRAFGADAVPQTYDDVETADLVVLVGSNLAWCHPVVYQRLAAAKAARPHMRVVSIDPRRTATSEIADLHLSLRPGSDVALFNGLLMHLERAGCRDAAYVTAHTTGLDAALEIARPFADVAHVVRETGLGRVEIERFFDMVAKTPKVLTLWSQGANQSASGTDKVNAIINCHLLTGRIGKEGCGPFSITGQPNAMGGREVGGLANQLAAHLDLADAHHRELVQEFWGSETVAATPGLKAVDLFQAAAQGRIRALWIMATNPVDSLPDADAVRAAIARIPFVVVSDVMRSTDTTQLAHVLLPAEAWGEKDGTVTNSERRISRQRRILPPMGEARPDWWAIAQVAQRLGWGRDFAWTHVAAVFREHAALSGWRSDIRRAFDISALADLDDAGYAALQPVQWPRPRGTSLEAPAHRLFADGGFFTADRKARFVPTQFRPPRAVPTKDVPLRLNTGRLRDQWHTMTRTGVAPRLSAHSAEPFAEVAPADAAAYGLSPAGLVRVSNERGAIVVRTLVSDRQQTGSVFVPIHWTDRFAAQARVDRLVAPETDPFSGQPESKAALVRLEPYPVKWHGFALTRLLDAAVPTDYWAAARISGGRRLELAGCSPLDDVEALAARLFGPHASAVSVANRRYGSCRLAAIVDDEIVGLLFVSPEPVEVARDWLTGRFAEPIAAAEAVALLAGRPAGARADPGRRICTCFDIGLNQIGAAVRRGCTTVAAVGEALGAGTNCGSCRPEIADIVAAETAAAARLMEVAE